MSLLPKPVDCGCSPDFVLSILDTLPGSVEMAACTHCGRTDLAYPIVSEDRPHDVQFHGYRLTPLSEDARAWASAWPRYAIVGEARVYLAAATRFQTKEERDAALAAAAAQQTGLTLRDKLLALGIPQGGPPASLPQALDGFIEIWNGLQLNDATPVDELLDAATRFNGPNRLAADVLSRRSDLGQLAMLLLWDREEKPRRGGRYLVQQFHLTGDDILLALRCRLGELPDNHTGELYEICAVLRKIGSAARVALPDLEAAAERVKNTDYYAHQDLLKLIERLRAAPEAG